MRRFVTAALLMLLLVCVAFAEDAPAANVIVGKVVTEKGSLNLRAKASDKSKVVTTIPNATCILVTEEGPDWCQVQWNDRVGYCKTAFLVMFREADPGLLDYRVLICRIYHT